MYSIKIKKKSMLRKRVECCDFSDSSKVVYRECINALLDYVEKNPTIQGIAANQINYNCRVCLCKMGKGYEVMVNPAIIREVGSVRSLEACESIGKSYYYVMRPIIGLVEWCTIDGVKHRKFMSYRTIRRVAHEIDHLNGILLSDFGIYWRGNEILK